MNNIKSDINNLKEKQKKILKKKNSLSSNISDFLLALAIGGLLENSFEIFIASLIILRFMHNFNINHQIDVIQNEIKNKNRLILDRKLTIKKKKDIENQLNNLETCNIFKNKLSITKQKETINKLEEKLELHKLSLAERLDIAYKKKYK